MTFFTNSVSRFVKDEDGATMVEYGLLVGLIAVVSVLVIAALGGKVFGAFDVMNTNLKTAAPKTPTG